MRTMQIENNTWHIFEFSKPFLTDLDDRSGAVFDFFVEQLNHWTYTLGDDIRYYISTTSLGKSLTFQIEKNLSEQNRCWLNLIKNGNNTLGVVLLSERNHEPIFENENERPLKKIYIDDIVVNPDLLSRGIGKEILGTILDDLKLITGIEQIDGIYCSIKEDNERSLGLFKKFGFVGTGIKKYGMETFFRSMDKPDKARTK